MSTALAKPEANLISFDEFSKFTYFHVVYYKIIALNITGIQLNETIEGKMLSDMVDIDERVSRFMKENNQSNFQQVLQNIINTQITNND
jgi:hypothetical protein